MQKFVHLQSNALPQGGDHSTERGRCSRIEWCGREMGFLARTRSSDASFSLINPVPALLMSLCFDFALSRYLGSMTGPLQYSNLKSPEFGSPSARSFLLRLSTFRCGLQLFLN